MAASLAAALHPRLVELIYHTFPYFLAWQVYYWLWHFYLLRSMETYTRVPERTMKYYIKKLRLPDKMPVEEKNKRVVNYFQTYWLECVCSFTHGIVMGVLLVPFMLRNPAFLWEAGLNTTDDTIWLPCYVFMGYLMNDFASLIRPMLQYGTTDDVLFVGHHVALLTTWASFYVDNWGHLFAVPTMITELTAPFINARVYMTHFGMEASVIYAINGLCAILTWYYLRMWMYCTILSFRIFGEFRQELLDGPLLRNGLVTTAYLFGVILQCFWCVLLTKGALSVLFGDNGKKKKKKG